MEYLIGVLIIWIVIVVLARHGKGGAVGQAIRNSDHAAWRMAMSDKQRELEELRKAEPKL